MDRELKTGDRVLVLKLDCEYLDRPEFGRRGTVVAGNPFGILANTTFCAVKVDGLPETFTFLTRRLQRVPIIEILAEV